LIDEDILAALVDSLNSLEFTVDGKTFTMRSIMGNEFVDFQQPTVAVFLNEHEPGYGGMDNNGFFNEAGLLVRSREMKAEVELRISATEQKLGAVIYHPRDVTKAMLDAIEAKVLYAWNPILMQFQGSILAGSIMTERDYYQFIMEDNRSKRLMKIAVHYQREWTMSPPGGSTMEKVEEVEYTTDDPNDWVIVP
jgi:hypothetical protein